MKNVSLCIDLSFCIVVLPLMAVIFPVERWFHHFPWYVVTVGVWLYALYALNRLVTVPWLMDNGRRRLGGIALAAVSVGVTAALARVVLYEPRPSEFDAGITRLMPMVQQYQQAVWSLFMIVEAFSFAVGLLTQANLQRSRRRAVEAERDRAEIQLYKARIKPHFMFNTLNSLYGLFLTHDPRGLESLEKFISMMRYIQSASASDLVALADEADYIGRYVGLQSLRLNEMTTVALDISIADPAAQVPPMLLVTFVENCFKHGVSPVERCQIAISLVEKDGTLSLTTHNRIFAVPHIGEHMGIDNCRRRLALLYPGRHSIDIRDDGTFFNVELKINLSK